MGVTFLQHRIVTGMHMKTLKPPVKIAGNPKLRKNEILTIIYGAVCVIYTYLICMLLAGAVTTSCNMTDFKFHRTYDIGQHVANDWNSFLNSATIVVLTIIFSKRKMTIAWIVRYGYPGCYSSAKCSGYKFLSNLTSIWITMLNLVLLVICNTSILNPGPRARANELTKLTVMYQNLRGLVPFSGLVKTNMPLDAGKLLELQSKIYKDKPHIVILTETWLSKEHLDNEILPDGIYKVYRRDRSKRSHPPDPDNPTKFRRKGGGVLVAVRTDIEVENDKVDVSSKAEMLSISMKANNTNYCISACYRVGTLGEQNLAEIDRHLRKVVSQKKFKAHFVIGDFNLPEINWSESQSATELGQGFIDLFNDLGLTQIIQQATHEKGKILDLLFSNLVAAVGDVVVMEKNELCSSDHFGIKFFMK